MTDTESKIHTTIFTCTICNQTITHKDTLTTGYGVNQAGDKVCFSCCGKQDIESMKKDGQIVLYLVKRENHYFVTNWPDTLSFGPVYTKTGRHNWAGKRYDVWFTVDGFYWHGVTYGDNTQICYCKKTKQQNKYNTPMSLS